MTCTLYGIPNCDTVKKARQWLDARGVTYRFHDLRADGLDAGRIQHWLAEAGSEVLVNRRSTTWKQLDETARQAATAGDTAVLIAHPTLIKRPVLEAADRLAVGFSADEYTDIFNG